MSKVHDVSAFFESYANGEIDVTQLEQEVKDIVSDVENDLLIASEALAVCEEENAN
jgi:hypothetical protein